MKLALHLCVYKRYDLEKIVIDYYKGLQKKYNFDIIVGGSEGAKSKAIAEGCIYYEIPNKPISDKHNKLLKHCKDYDGVIAIGSDDLIDEKTFKHYFKRDTTLNRCYSFGDVYFYRTSDNKLNYYKGGICGAGRFFTKACLERMNYEIWENGRNTGIDRSGYVRMIRGGVTLKNTTLPENDFFIVDVKHTINISSHAIVDAGDKVNLNKFYKRFPKETIDRIKGLSQTVNNPVEYKDNEIVDFIGNGSSNHLKNGCYTIEYHQAKILKDKGYGIIL